MKERGQRMRENEETKTERMRNEREKCGRLERCSGSMMEVRLKEILKAKWGKGVGRVKNTEPFLLTLDTFAEETQPRVHAQVRAASGS